MLFRKLSVIVAFFVFGVTAEAFAGKSLVEVAFEQGLRQYQNANTDRRNDSGGHSDSLSLDDAALLYSPQQKQATFSNCKDQFPSSTPIRASIFSATHNPIALCSDNFAVLYSKASKTPLVVVERLTAEQLSDAKGEERSDQFYADPRVPKAYRAELSDYRGTGLDRGHQAPAADAPNSKSMAQSFALTNIIPQDPINNRKIWSKIESDVRKYAQRAGGNVYVFTGPLFDDGFTTIGQNKVWVPTRLYKLIYDESRQRAWAYVLVNSETRIERPMDYQTFISVTGLRLLDHLPVHGSILAMKN